MNNQFMSNPTGINESDFVSDGAHANNMHISANNLINAVKESPSPSPLKEPCFMDPSYDF